MGDSASLLENGMAGVGKTEPSRDGSTSSTESTPEVDAEAYPPEHPQAQKRKGGRKPIYATSEERKQRNRQAQAAFRERRTEYIKQLESTIKHHEETLQSLQQSQRSAADECLMLRYKNSLLERLLLEKGIDVQAELRTKTGSPTVRTPRPPNPMSAPPPHPQMQRAIANRHHQARRSQGMLSKTEPNHGLPQVDINLSPLSQPTPTSHLSSPSTAATRSPNLVSQGGTTSPSAVPVAQHQQPLQPQPSAADYQHHPQAQHRPSLMTNVQPSNKPYSAPVRGGMEAGYGEGQQIYYPYPSPFQSHMDQLEQEYDAQADLLDEEPSDRPSGRPQQYPPSVSHQQVPPQGVQQPFLNQRGIPPQFPTATNAQTTESHGGGAVFGTMNHLFDPYDPMLDADPFGLSASMHFPTQFSSESR